MALDAQSLFDQSRCFTCLGISEAEALELALLQNIVGGAPIPPPAPPLNPAVVDWAARVVANGGAAPSTSTKTAMSTFYDALQAASLDTQMKGLCVFVPDSLTAATTPLIVGTGLGLWTNTGFVAADLTVDGLKGDGATKFLNSGVNPSTALTGNSGGITLVNTTTSNLAENDAGCATGVAASPSYLMAISNAGNGIFDYNDQTVSRITVANSIWEGYTSVNRIASADLKVYKASPTVAHTTLANSAVANASAPPPLSAYVFAWNVSGAAASFSRKRLFLAAFHNGLTITQSAAFYAAIAPLQASISPVVQHSLVTAWQARVTSNGGAAPSVTTTNALNRFCASLDTFGLTSSIIALNPFVPDNLIAACTPLIQNAGNALWTNNNFVLADLTVNGLIGNGSTKYLNTGVLGTAAGLSVSNGGMTMVTQTASAGGENDMGCNNANAPSFALIIDFSGNSYNDIYDQSTTRIGPVANTGFKGYHSNNRITTTDFKVYQATSSAAHAAFGSNAGTNALLPSNLAAFAVFTHCWNNSGTPGSFSTKRVSFAAVHQGLTAAQSSNFFDCIQQLRLAMGGTPI